MKKDARTVSLPASADQEAQRAFRMHERLWQANRYVYPVVSRRSRGISIGVNLNPDKVCNFDCIYCSVDRTQETKAASPDWAVRDVDLAVLRAELQAMMELVATGGIYQFDPFDRIPEELHRVNDIAFSGDGEPTTCPQFAEAVKLAADVVEHSPAERQGAAPIKLVLITNATMFHKEAVRDVLAFMDAHHGEIWAKLDAGTDEYYHLVDRTGVSFSRVLENVRWCCQTRPTVIQSLFMKVHGQAPTDAEIAAYAGHLAEIADSGGRIKLVQLYTVARRTTEVYATPLSGAELEGIAGKVREKFKDAAVEVYP